MNTNALRELYQEIIIDHNKNPRHFGHLAHPTHHAKGSNPLCGDKLTLDLLLDEKGIIQDIRFNGAGCAISTASASLMTEQLMGKSSEVAQTLFTQFHDALTTSELAANTEEKLGKLAVLLGVREYPTRVKCATLAWHTLQAALKHEDTPASTE